MNEPEVFKKKIWTWMEEKGVVSKLKLQFRHHMIDILKGTDLDKEVRRNGKNRQFSPKYNAINLLLAEYLLKQDYSYTLSIFAMENPIIASYIEHNSMKSDATNQYKFTDSDLHDILNTLGFSKDRLDIEDFQNFHSDSAIICLFQRLSHLLSVDTCKASTNDNCRNIASTQTHGNSLDDSHSKQRYDLYREVQDDFDKELTMAIACEKEKFERAFDVQRSQMEAELQTEKEKLKKQHYKFRSKLLKEFKVEYEKMIEKERLKEIEIENELQRDLERERRKLFEEFQLKEKNNVNSKSLAELQQSSLEIALKAVQHQSNKLRRKEDLLNRKMSEFEKLRRSVDSASQTSCEFNQSTVKRISQEVQTDSDKHDQIIQVPRLIDQETQTYQKISRDNQTTDSKRDKTAQTNPIKVDQKDLDFVSVSNTKDIPMQVKDALKKLHSENIYFKAYNKQQVIQIQELVKNYSLLNDEVKKAYAEVERKSSEITKLKTDFGKSSLRDTSNESKLIESSYEFEHHDVDDNIDQIKKTLKILEEEGEELEQSYCRFKQQQLESNKQTARSSASPVFEMRDNLMRSTPKGLLMRHRRVKESCVMRRDEPILSSTYLDRNFIDRSPISRPFDARRVHGPTMSIDANIFRYYATANRDMKLFNSSNPKSFGDMLIERYKRPESELKKYFIDATLDKSKDDVHIGKVNQNVSKYRRWSLPSSIYNKSPLTHRKHRRDNSLIEPSIQDKSDNAQTINEKACDVSNVDDNPKVDTVGFDDKDDAITPRDDSANEGDESIAISSVEISDGSQISVPALSDHNDSFWN